MSRLPLLIHPGFHKTGTTFLQSSVFSTNDVFARFGAHADADRLFVRPHELTFDPRQARAELEAFRAQAGDRIPVLSTEILCGNPFDGARDCATIAKRLRAAVNDARILFTVREPLARIRSIYQQYVKMGGTLLPEPFLEGEAPAQFYKFDPIVVEHHRLVEVYADLFGPENVLVLTQEQLKADLPGFLATLTSFAAGAAVPVDASRSAVGVSPSQSALPLLRAANRFLGLPLNPEMRRGPRWLGKSLRRAAMHLPQLSSAGSNTLKAAVQARYPHRFADSNARLQRFSPAELGTLGYALPAASHRSMSGESA